MTVFQIHGAGEDPVTRYLAFWSLMCALVSLLYGCLFIIRFGTMRKPYKAAEWALVGLTIDVLPQCLTFAVGSTKLTNHHLE